MKFNKRSFLVIEIVLVVLTVIMIGIVILGRIGKESKKIFVVVQNSEDTDKTSLKYGLKMAEQDSKYDLVIVSTGEISSIKEEASIVEREIDNGADAIIVEPVEDKDIELYMEENRKSIPILLINSGISDSNAKLPVVEVDNKQMGKDLIANIIESYSGGIEGKSFGVILADYKMKSIQDRKKVCEDGIKDAGGAVIWTESIDKGGEIPNLKSLPKVDVIVSLDDYSTCMVGEEKAENNIHGAVVYGIGNSTEAVYHLENKNVECLFVPDDFAIGYKSFLTVSKKLDNPFNNQNGDNVSYTILDKNNIFSEENQRLLFIMGQ